MTLGVVDTDLGDTSGSGLGFSTISVGLTDGVGVLAELSTFEVRRDFPQRTQYLRIGLFAFPQLAQVLIDHSSRVVRNLNY